MSQDFKSIFAFLDQMKIDLKNEIIDELAPKFDRIQTSLNNLT